MASINSSLTVYQGEYKEILVTVQNSANQAIDLTNVRLIKWALSETEQSAVLLQKSFPASGITHGGSNGIYTIVLSGVDTESLTPGVYYHEAQYDLGGKTVTSIVGSIRIRPTII